MIYFLITGYLNMSVINIYLYKRYTPTIEVLNTCMMGILNFIITFCIVFFIDMFSHNIFDVIRLLEETVGYHQATVLMFYVTSILSTFICSFLVILKLKSHYCFK